MGPQYIMGTVIPCREPSSCFPSRFPMNNGHYLAVVLSLIRPRTVGQCERRRCKLKAPLGGTASCLLLLEKHVIPACVFLGTDQGFIRRSQRLNVLILIPGCTARASRYDIQTTPIASWNVARTLAAHPSDYQTPAPQSRSMANPYRIYSAATRLRPTVLFQWIRLHAWQSSILSVLSTYLKADTFFSPTATSHLISRATSDLS
ncbi:unnamed protein product [Periconia digitata]|uniref:Uncharacterized protein n=1 Tax=Periconia digitata TaxID=1303443 RepID=A0A9W4UK41_9PLEO|nr:unnamed protein product [Periconia digitata]